eukprot:m.177028 g.177028  ORF g.177028 m.177028 type:complete len:1122 (-) comp25321_c1_seq2:184-3549(-)
MAELKLGEKLTILNSHCRGLLRRTLFVLQRFRSDRPQFMADKAFDHMIKSGLKRFPNIDFNKSTNSPLHAKREMVLDALEDSYFVLVDILEFKTVLTETVTTFLTQKVSFNLTATPEMTSLFLELLSNYVALMLLMARIEDRRAIAALYSVAHELAKGTKEPSYPRLGEMLNVYEAPLKALPNDFTAHAQMIAGTLFSVKEVFDTRYKPAEQLRKENALSIIHNPAQMAAPEVGQTLCVDMVSSDQMIRWSCLCYCLIPEWILATLDNNVAPHMELLKMALADGFAVTLFRTETFAPHAAYETVFSHLKDPKRFKEHKLILAEQVTPAVTQSGVFHQDRREFLRYSLKQLHLVLSDKPGLLGPKASLVVRALVLARDEIMWLLRHQKAAPPRAKAKINQAHFQDSKFPELLFYYVELQGLFKQYRTILCRYYVEFLSGYDTDELTTVLSGLTLSERENQILSAIKEQISSLTIESEARFDGLRLDWLRLQTEMGGCHTQAPIESYPHFASVMNMISFHTNFVDNLNEFVLQKTAAPDLWFYLKAFNSMFQQCLGSPAQIKYAIGFPIACDFASLAACPAVPEERIELGRVSTDMANTMLIKMAEKAAHAISLVANHHVKLSEQLLATNAAQNLADKVNKQKKTPAKAKATKPSKTASSTMSSEQIQQLHVQQQELSDICWSINRHRGISIFNYVFSPREYLMEMLDKSFARTLHNFAKSSSDAHPITRPSVFILRTKAYMAALRSTENHLAVDMSSVFSNGLLDQTLVDVEGKRTTLATMYVHWYLDLVSKSDGIGVSHSRKSFFTVGNLPFKAEEYTDIAELKALCTILGPYGVKQLNDGLLFRLSKHVGEIKKIVQANRENLDVLKNKTEMPTTSSDALRRLKEVDECSFHLIQVGVSLSFRSLLMEALRAVLQARIPFIFNAISDLHENAPKKTQGIDALALTAGINSVVDPQLLRLVDQHCTNSDAEFNTWSLMMVMAAACMRNQSFNPHAAFNISLDGLENNGHCMATALNAISSCVFTITATPGEAPTAITDAQTEFIRIVSLLLLRLSAEKETTKNKNSVLAILDKFVRESKFLTADVLETYFPYSLIRTAFHELYKRPNKGGKGPSKSDDSAF